MTVQDRAENISLKETIIRRGEMIGTGADIVDMQRVRITKLEERIHDISTDWQAAQVLIAGLETENAKYSEWRATQTAAWERVCEDWRLANVALTARLAEYEKNASTLVGADDWK